jgi:translation initiation factor IF-2
MDKVRISEIAKELGMKSKEVVESAKDLGLEVKAANSSVTPETAERLVNFIMSGDRGEATQTKEAAPKKEEEIPPKEKEVKKEKPKEKKKEETSKAKKVEKQTTSPKASKKSTDEQEAVSKPETKPAEVEKEKIEEKPEEKPKETLATASIKKRRGFVIVKKKKPKVEEKPKSSHKVHDFEMPKAFDDATKKKKKAKKAKKTTTKKDDSSQIDILANRELSDVKLDLIDDMVVLPDFTVKQEEVRQKRTKTFDPNHVKTVKKPSFIQQGIQRKSKKRRKRKVETKAEDIKTINIPEDIRVYEFAEKLSKKPSDIIKALFSLGVMVTKNDFLDKDAIEILSDEFDIDVNITNPVDEFDYEKIYDEGKAEDMVPRPPIITIMGHVDHGKTSLLDKIRQTNVTQSEHGGITQHIGAYTVEKDGKKITFIDTPGHEAFTQMRSRGAQVTDIAIIVVAADDGVKPQTKESISHAKAAGIPFIVAINKIDKPTANPDMVKSGLAELDVTPVDWGGDYEFVNVSAKSGEGIDDLLEVLLLQAEILELKANPNAYAKTIVVESKLEKGRGPVATVISKNGTLKVGDNIISGSAYGKVRALIDYNGKNIKNILPGETGVVVGLNSIATAGEKLFSTPDEKTAREFALKRAEYERQKELSKSTKVSLEELTSQIASGKLKSLPLIIKTDALGSLEAIKGSLEKLKNEEVKVDIIHSDVGGITQSDIALAKASENCIIMGFNIRPTGTVKEEAKKLGVEIKTYNVIYDMIDDVKALLGGLLSPIVKEEALGQAEVRDVFMVPKVGAIAGCIVTDGTINRGVSVRVIRDGVVIYEGEISSLKRFKDDVREVAKGYECGIGVEGYNDIKVGDYLESFKKVEEKATFE